MIGKIFKIGALVILGTLCLIMAVVFLVYPSVY